MGRIHPHLDVGVRPGRERDGAFVELERLHELAREVLDPRDELQAFRVRRFAPRQREHALDDLAHAPRVHANDVGEPVLVLSHARRLREQLTGMAHRAERIADLVRDARAHTVQTLATGIVNFGGGIGGWFEPVLTADGDPVSAPGDYPAPPLRKNSLICQIAGRWFQGGRDASFTSPVSGELILAPNDRYPADNRGGWAVTIVQTQPDAPTRGRSARLSIGWLEFVQVTQTRSGEVPMIAGKRTAVRIFLSSGLGAATDIGSGPGQIFPVDGQVSIRTSLGTATLPFTGARAFAAGTHRRDNPDHSVQVELPLGLLRGAASVTVRATVRGHVASDAGFSASAAATVTFVASRTETVLPLLLTNTDRMSPAEWWGSR